MLPDNDRPRRRLRKSVVKPPLGIMPHKLWLEQRRNDILAAMKRYAAENLPVPAAWVEELAGLIS